MTLRRALRILPIFLPTLALVFVIQQEISSTEEEKQAQTTRRAAPPEELPDSYEEALLFESWQTDRESQTRGRKIEILTIQPDGSALHQVTSDGRHYDPAWSPDRQKIAVVSERGILILKPDGTELKQLTLGRFWLGPQWLTNDLLAFVGIPGTPGGSGLYLQQLGRRDRPVELDLGGVRVELVLISPNRRWLALLGTEGHERSLYLAETQDLAGTLRRLPSWVEPGTALPPPSAWTPDSRHLVVPRSENGGKECIALTREGVEAPGILPPHTSLYPCQLAFSPDGRRIAYWQSSSIWIMDQDGKKRHLIHSPSNATFSNLTWGVDRFTAEADLHAAERLGGLLEPPLPDTPGTILFEKWFRGGDTIELWAVQPDGSNPRRLTRGHWDTHIAPSPNGQRIAFFRSGAGILTMKPDGTDLQTLPLSGLYPQWLSNDSILVDGLYLVENTAGCPGLYVYSLQRNCVVAKLDTEGLEMFKPVVSPNGQQVMFRAGEGMDARIYLAEVQDIEGTQRVLDHGGFPEAWAPDGNSVVVTGGFTSCQRLTLEGKSVEWLRDIQECNMWFSPDGENIVFQWENSIWVMDRNGFHRRVLVEPRSEEFMLRSPVWVPSP